MAGTPERISDGRSFALQNDGLRTPEMDRIVIPGLVIDARKNDTSLWKRLIHGAVPLKPANSAEGMIAAHIVDGWKKELGKSTLIFYIPIGSWGPVRREDLNREPPELRYMVTTVQPRTLRESSLMLAYEALTGKSYDAPQERSFFLTGQFEYDA
jgi:hypothetical protein